MHLFEATETATLEENGNDLEVKIAIAIPC